MNNYETYIVSSHGNATMPDDYITLPPGIRVIHLCNHSLCPADYLNNYYLIKLLLTKKLGQDPTLRSTKKMIDKTFKDIGVTHCIYSGNIDDRFKMSLVKLKCYKQMNKVQNINFSADNGNTFRDGIFKYPLDAEIKNRSNNQVIQDYKGIYNFFKKKYSNSQDVFNAIKNTPFEMLLIPNKKGKLYLDVKSPYYTFHPKGEPNNESVYNNNMTNLRDLIDSLKSKEDFDNEEKMITIIISTCIGNTGQLFEKLCSVGLGTYINLDVLYFKNDGSTCITTLANYDIKKMNKYSFELDCPINCNTNGKMPLVKFDINKQFIINSNGVFDATVTYAKDNANIDEKRVFKNILTEFVINYFFNEKTYTNNFVIIIDRFFNTMINNYCRQNKISKKNIIFIYKGGNVFSMAYKNAVQEYPKSIFENIKKKFSIFFRKSDFDFSILINPNIDNYDKIYSEISNLSYYVLVRLRDFFNDRSKYFGYYNMNINNKYCKLFKTLNNLNKATTLSQPFNGGQFNRIIFEDIVYDHNNNSMPVELFEYQYVNDNSQQGAFSTNTSSKRHDIYIYNDNSNANNINVSSISDDVNTFYISVNTTIDFDVQDVNGQLKKIKFNLVRMKTNFLLFFDNNQKKEKVNISGELIDVSIPHKQSYGMDKYFIDINKSFQHYNISDDYYVVGESIENLKKDLENIFSLYTAPWLIEKYEKRIYRLMFICMILLLKEPATITEKLKYLIDVYTFVNNIKNNNKNIPQSMNIFTTILSYTIKYADTNKNDPHFDKYLDIIKDSIRDFITAFSKLQNWIQSDGKYDISTSYDSNYMKKYLKYKKKYMDQKRSL
jgi:hypothetical protein